MKSRSRATLVVLPLLVLALSYSAYAQTRAARPAKPAAEPARTAPPAPRAATPAPEGEAGEALDQVAATVNDDVVLMSDVEEQLYLFLQRSGARPNEVNLDTLRRAILDQLIDDRLILAEAKRQNVTATDAEVAKQVDAAIADAKERLGGEAKFQEQLKQENTSEARLREKYKGELQRQIMAQRVVDKMVPKKKVPAAEAEAYFNAHKEQFPKVPGQLRLAVIQMPPAPESTEVLKAKSRIEAIRKRIVAGEKFAKVAAEVSEDPSSARSGGDLGFFTRGNMEPTVEKAALEGKLGAVSAPMLSAYGWHLIEPIERDTLKAVNGRDSLDADGAPVIEAHARHILVRVAPTEADVERTRQLAERVRGEALKGTPFGTLVRRYSKYNGPTQEDGDVGFVSLGNLQQQIREGLDSLEVGQVSDVLVNQSGFNVFKVLDRKPEREYTLEEIREELPEAVGQIQFREKYTAWVKGLRAKAQIDVKKL